MRALTRPRTVAVATILFTLGAAALVWPALSIAAAPLTDPGASQAPNAASLDSLFAAPVLDLGSLERAVTQRNPSLAAAREAWRAMDARADGAGLLMDPMFEGMLAPRTFTDDATPRSYMLRVAQHLPILGQLGPARRSARALARAAREDVRTARLDLLREARRLYYAYYRIVQGQRITDELLDLLGQFRRVALQKYSAGIVGLEDALRADAEIGMLDHQRILLVRDRRVVAARLRALLHDNSKRAFPEPRGRADEMLDPLRRIAAVEPEAAVEGRPDIRMRDAMRDARAEEVTVARRMRLPEFTLFARYDRFMMEEARRPQVGLMLNLPVGWGRLGAAEREAGAALARAEYERQSARDAARAELEETRARVEDTEHGLHVLEEQVVPATEKALASTRAAYEADRADFLALLDAERDLMRARLERDRAVAEFGEALADLWRAAAAENGSMAEEESQ